MPADWSWVPERARFAAAAARLGMPPGGAPCRRRGLVLSSVWVGEGRWCLVDTGATETPTDEEIEGFDTKGLSAFFFLACGFPRATTAPRSDGTIYVGCAVVDSRYVTLVEAIWPDVVWRSRGEREPVVGFSGQRPVAVVAPIAEHGGEIQIRELTRPDPDEDRAKRIAQLEREALRGQALRSEIERLAAQGEGYASARDLRRALALEGTET